MARKTIVFRTKFSTDECLSHIMDIADEAKWAIFSFSHYKGSKPLLVDIRGQEIVMRKRIYYRNSFQPFFYGRLISEVSGARLEGSFKFSRPVRLFMIIWTLVVATEIPGMIASLRIPAEPSSERWRALLPVAMIAAMLLLAAFGWLISRGHERLMIETLKKALDARVQELEPDVPPVDAYTNRPIG